MGVPDCQSFASQGVHKQEEVPRPNSHGITYALTWIVATPAPTSSEIRGAGDASSYFIDGDRSSLLSSTSGSARPVQGFVSGIYEMGTARSDNAFKVIDSATATISNDKRPRVRMRLRKSTAINRIRICAAGGRVL